MSFKQLLISRERLEDILKSVGVTIVSETNTNILAYCPFHDNRDSPAFNISVNPPYPWKCWNGKCDERGNIITLLTKKGYTRDEAWRIVGSDVIDFDQFCEYLDGLLEDIQEPENKWANEDMSRFAEEDKQAGYPARDYFLSRGITEEAYEYFQLGFSIKKDMVVIPVFDHLSTPVGIIGRSIAYKRYQYSTGMQRSNIVWNAHNVTASEIILTEGALDAIYIWQAGHRNVGSILGSSVSPAQWGVIKDKVYAVTCFYDNDDAGNSVRDTIFENVNDLEVNVLTYPDRLVTLEDGTERPLKDPGDLTVEEIQHMISSKKSKIEVLLEQANGIMKAGA